MIREIYIFLATCNFLVMAMAMLAPGAPLWLQASSLAEHGAFPPGGPQAHSIGPWGP